ncbi:MAG TPA: ABC transporter substrate-binding protein [Caldimonas sp.]|jgi:branched-chain amino acid transport system substrate-binding protein|nr:ABC transporter substrate-binding protein [Caldimonas sp.]HEX2540570.1 ABC transporter substrate-binding protein [Caldimonas sp.]
MNLKRRKIVQGLGGAGVLAAQPFLGVPALAQAQAVRVGVIAPKAGIAGTIGECGLRGTQYAVERINAGGGIAGRKVELIVEEETNPKDSIERLRKLVLQDKVDCVQGIVSSGVSLAMGAVAEEMKAMLIFWDGTTQDGVKETMPNPRYVFRSTDNECEAVMGSLLAVKHWKGKFKTVAGINPDYSYGRNNFAAFQALLKKFGIEHTVVADQWPKVGTTDLNSHVAALKAAKPDLVFSSLLFADLPIFMRTAHAAGLMEGGTKFVFPAAGFQHTGLKKAFTPEGMIFGHNTLYFDHPKASALQKQFVQEYEAKYKDYPHWEADRAYFAMQVYKAGVEAAQKAKNAWPGKEDVISAMEGIKVESLGGPGQMRKDHIAEQTFYQGITTHNNRFDFPTLGSIDTMYSDQLQKPAGADFWKWIETAQIKL